jgi:hypothetical protein
MYTPFDEIFKFSANLKLSPNHGVTNLKFPFPKEQKSMLKD